MGQFTWIHKCSDRLGTTVNHKSQSSWLKKSLGLHLTRQTVTHTQWVQRLSSDLRTNPRQQRHHSVAWGFDEFWHFSSKSQQLTVIDWEPLSVYSRFYWAINIERLFVTLWGGVGSGGFKASLVHINQHRYVNSLGKAEAQGLRK